MSTKEYDLIVFGATSFTGKLVVEYLNEKLNSAMSQHCSALKITEQIIVANFIFYVFVGKTKKTRTLILQVSICILKF